MQIDLAEADGSLIVTALRYMAHGEADQSAVPNQMDAEDYYEWDLSATIEGEVTRQRRDRRKSTTSGKVVALVTPPPPAITEDPPQ